MELVNCNVLNRDDRRLDESHLSHSLHKTQNTKQCWPIVVKVFQRQD